MISYGINSTENNVELFKDFIEKTVKKVKE